MIIEKKCVRGFTLLLIAIISFYSIAKAENVTLSKKGASEADQGVASGKIVGTVKDSSGNPLLEAGIEAVEAGKKGMPEARGGFTLSYTNGKYALELPPGTYKLKATFPNYETTIIKEVKVEAGKIISLDIILSQALVEIDEMKVVAKAKGNTEIVQLLRRKTASNIMDNISAETIAKMPDSDVAGILTRMPGVSISEGKYL
ncbi:MAG: carboxypeptidase regulatory-like domain-containing protein, partial [Deltaproteobacteria bacterium]|nr:carboxypeptidase regulatory-like domain-containing protein [Deltaproteobacteria bacterium]